jgi:hypothetical protein
MQSDPEVIPLAPEVLLGEWFTVDEGVVRAVDMFDEDGIGLASLSLTKVP